MLIASIINTSDLLNTNISTTQDLVTASFSTNLDLQTTSMMIPELLTNSINTSLCSLTANTNATQNLLTAIVSTIEIKKVDSIWGVSKPGYFSEFASLSNTF